MGVTYNGTGAALTVNQQGVGNLIELQDGGVARVTVLDGGNVGIGTTQPLQALHVLANARVDGNATLGDSVTADAHTVSGTMGVTYSGTGTALTVNQQGTGKLFEVQDGGVARVTVLDGGNMGIGVATPGHKLHVGGDTRIEGNLIVNGTQTIVNTDVGTTEQLIITNDGTGPALIVNQSGATHHVADFYDTDISTTVPALRVANGANVGIGTADPQQKLQVVGTAQATLFSGSGASLTALNADNVSTGTLTIERGGTGASTLTSGKLLVGNGITTVLQPANLHWDNVNSRLGISTSTPSVPLEVADGRFGTAAILRLNSPVSNGEVSKIEFKYWDDTTAKAEIRGGRTGLNGGYLNFNTADATNVILTRMSIDSNGNVGIGTVTPLAQLHINNNATSALMIRGYTPGVEASTGIWFSQVDQTNFNMVKSKIVAHGTGMWGQHDLRFCINSENNTNSANDTTDCKLVIHKTGNVGIGTTNPQAKAHITGPSGSTLLLTTITDAVNENFNIQLGLPTLTASSAKITYTSLAGDKSKLGFFTQDANNALLERLTISANGNVGIGATNPQSILDVRTSGTVLVGEISGGGVYNTNAPLHIRKSNVPHLLFEAIALNTCAIAVNGSSGMVYGAQSGDHTFRTGCAHNDNFASTGTERLRITSAGNVGIGTTNPLTRLHVNGGITLDGETITSPYSASADAANLTNTYISFTHAGTTDDWAYLRQIGGYNGYHMVLDFHDDGNDARFSIRDVLNSATTDVITTRFTVASGGNVGIGTTNPVASLHINTTNTVVLDGGTWTSHLRLQRGGGIWHIVTDNTTDWNQNLYWYASTSAAGNPVKKILGFENDNPNAGTVGIFTFTGQHLNFVKDIQHHRIANYIGLIVSANQNDYVTINNGVFRGAHSITINEALPIVALTCKSKDKSCFGVISASEDPNERSQSTGRVRSYFTKELGDTRVYINSLGEGSIWVVNTNGHFESGDFITSSDVSGYGMKQDDDLLHNYTVAKITMDCNFNPAMQPVKRIKKDEHGINILDEHGELQWEDSEDVELAYKIRYLDSLGHETDMNNSTHIAALVGCTYHCG
jgi:hypothetical protein